MMGDFILFFTVTIIDWKPLLKLDDYKQIIISIEISCRKSVGDNTNRGQIVEECAVGINNDINSLVTKH